MSNTSKISSVCKMAINVWTRLVKHSLFMLIFEICIVVGKQKVVQLNEDNWKEMLDKEWMVEL